MPHLVVVAVMLKVRTGIIRNLKSFHRRGAEKKHFMF